MDYQKDEELGHEVAAHLVTLGIETPMRKVRPFVSVQEQRAGIAKHVAAIMSLMDLDLSDDSLCETPARIGKMYATELFQGLDYANFPKATVVENKMKYNEMVIERNIQVYSTCEHHLLPVVGGAAVAYIPKDKVVGLSKLNRIVDFFCRRPQIQERLTEQIHATLCFLLDTEDVAVIIDAEHMCVKLRGVEDACSDTVTSRLSGRFLDTAVRAEFIALATAKSRR